MNKANVVKGKSGVQKMNFRSWNMLKANWETKFSNIFDLVRFWKVHKLRIYSPHVRSLRVFSKRGVSFEKVRIALKNNQMVDNTLPNFYSSVVLEIKLILRFSGCQFPFQKLVLWWVTFFWLFSNLHLNGIIFYTYEWLVSFTSFDVKSGQVCQGCSSSETQSS